uniref:Uncharacterized protein n=1 Tax=Panagrolaimus superbus TaxID=310955 RepID=A0A914YVT5_9BILA
MLSTSENLASDHLANPEDPRTPSKKRKVAVQTPIPEDLDATAVALARCTSEKEMLFIVADTAPLCCTWIASMQDNDASQIPETFMKKFPCFVSNASLLHEDYKCNMEMRDLPVADFADAFKKILPAIFKLAEAKKIRPPNSPEPVNEDDAAWLGCKLLINLVPLYCKRNKLCKPDRLFVEGWDSTYINAMHQIRRDLKQTAPMIFVVTAYPVGTRSYLIATDDFALKIKGTFFDAFQSLMELHYIFDLAYVKELKPFFLLLERLAHLEINRSYTSLMDLYYELQHHAAPIDEESDRQQQPPTVASEQSSTEIPDLTALTSSQSVPSPEEDVVQIN